jgi:hypothetical protein
MAKQGKKSQERRQTKGHMKDMHIFDKNSAESQEADKSGAQRYLHPEAAGKKVFHVMRPLLAGMIELIKSISRLLVERRFACLVVSERMEK